MSTYPVDPPIETRRLDALGNAIAWGNAHYDPRLKCARAADGRVYTIAITCTATVHDTSGSVPTTFPVAGTQTVDVTVAHDQRKS